MVTASEIQHTRLKGELVFQDFCQKFMFAHLYPANPSTKGFDNLWTEANKETYSMDDFSEPE